MILSILIPTVIGRERPLELLTNRIYSQIGDLKAESKVEVIVMKDNKEISIGEKRNQLYAAASGEYSVQIDDMTYRDWETDRKSTRLNSSHITRSRMPSSA